MSSKCYICVFLDEEDVRNNVGAGVWHEEPNVLGILRLNQRPGTFVSPKYWSVLASCDFAESESLLWSEIG